MESWTLQVLDWQRLLSIQEYYSFFIKQNQGKSKYVLVYVNDLLITEDDSLGIKTLKVDLDSTFSIKDLSFASFLGLELSISS